MNCSKCGKELKPEQIVYLMRDEDLDEGEHGRCCSPECCDLAMLDKKAARSAPTPQPEYQILNIIELPEPPLRTIRDIDFGTMPELVLDDIRPGLREIRPDILPDPTEVSTYIRQPTRQIRIVADDDEKRKSEPTIHETGLERKIKVVD